MEYVIRQVRTDEILCAASLEVECFPADELAGHDKMVYRHKLIPELTLGCFVEDKLIGLINGCRIATENIPHEPKRRHIPDGESAYVSVLCVKDGYRKKGIGAKLLEKFKETVLQGQPGVKRLVLICRLELIPFYQKHGYKYNGESEAKLGEAQFYDMTMLLTNNTDYGLTD